ncbi:MAG TPA: hypothetical protein PK571_10160 [Methylotenera sp.]|jgi:hypothetical protein|nr:hypothetical protein [Methylotenera sp.]
MKTLHKTLLALLTVSALAPSIAQAQSGSRLCGYVAIETPTKIGLLYEARDDDSNYHYQCDQAIEKTSKSIQKNPQLKAMKWNLIKRFKCEEVGNMGFVNKGQSSDICDNMEAHNAYKVMKQGTANAIYEKQ